LMGGGSEPPEFGVIMGVSNVGKTAFALNMAKAYLLQGLRGAIFTTETNKEKLSRRFALSITEGDERILNNRISFIKKKGGHLDIYDLSGRAVSISYVNAVIKKKGYDFIIGDSFDDFISLDRYKDLRYELKSIYVYLRRLAKNYKLIIWNTTQSNRGGYRKKSLSEENVSEDINKINKSETVLTLNQTAGEQSTLSAIRIGVRKSKLGSKGKFKEASFIFEEDKQLFIDINKTVDNYEVMA
jgi:archaellum biogenesis ATPase FlaH